MVEDEATVKKDEKGRMILPKSDRIASRLSKGAYFTVKATDKIISMESAGSVAEKYLGIFQVANWPEDLDEFIIELNRK